MSTAYQKTGSIEPVYNLAPPPGLEPGTPSLTARCSTIELQGNKKPPGREASCFFDNTRNSRR